MAKFTKFLCILLVNCLASTQANVYVDPETAQENRCGGAIEADSGSLTFPAQGQSIQAGEICIWTIHLQSTETARLNFSSLDVEGDATDCEDAAVRLYSLSNLIPANKSESYTFCNNELPPDGNFYLSGNLVTVIFRSTQDGADAGTGFTLNWEGISFQPIPKIHESTYTSAVSGIIRYPIEGDYPANHVNTWLIKTVDTNPNLNLDLNLAYVNLERCELEDPCLCDALILYQITTGGVLKENTRLCGNSSGTILNSLGPNFILGFFTDHRESPGEGTGFEMVYKPRFPSTTTTPRPTEPSSSTTTRPTTTRPPTDNATTSCGGLIFGNQGVIEYKVGQSYDDAERCIWTVRTPYRSGIRFTVAPLNLENSYDFLTLHAINETGISEERILTGRTSGTTVVEFNATVALVSFYSDFSNSYNGFRIEFEAVGPFDGSVNYYEDFNTIAEVDQPDSLQYPATGQYRNLELSTFVITRPTRLPYWSVRAEFTSLNLETNVGDDCKDKLHIYIARRDVNPERELKRFTPEEGVCALPQLDAFPTQNMQAAVIIMSTDGDGRSNGFKLDWRLQVPL